MRDTRAAIAHLFGSTVFVSVLMLTGAAATTLFCGLAAWKARNETSTRMLISVGLMVMVSLMGFQFEGDPWQIDMHMYFFAALGILITLSGISAVIAATNEISNQVTQASERSMSAINAKRGRSGEAALSILTASEQLTQDMSRLRSENDSFLGRIRFS